MLAHRYQSHAREGFICAISISPRCLEIPRLFEMSQWHREDHAWDKSQTSSVTIGAKSPRAEKCCTTGYTVVQPASARNTHTGIRKFATQVSAIYSIEYPSLTHFPVPH